MDTKKGSTLLNAFHPLLQTLGLLLPGVDVLAVDVLEAVASEVPMVIGGRVSSLLLRCVGLLLLRSLLAVPEYPGLRRAG